MASSAKVRPGSRFRDADVTAMLEDEDVGLVVSIRAFPTGPYGGGVRWKRPCFSLVFFALSLSLSLSVMAYEFARPEFSCRVESAVVKSCKPKGGRCRHRSTLKRFLETPWQ